jgi:hypothetical protein
MDNVTLSESFIFGLFVAGCVELLDFGGVDWEIVVHGQANCPTQANTGLEWATRTHNCRLEWAARPAPDRNLRTGSKIGTRAKLL